MTKEELEAVVDKIADMLEAALDPEFTREEVVRRVKETARTLSEETEEAE